MIHELTSYEISAVIFSNKYITWVLSAKNVYHALLGYLWHIRQYAVINKGIKWNINLLPLEGPWPVGHSPWLFLWVCQDFYCGETTIDQWRAQEFRSGVTPRREEMITPTWLREWKVWGKSVIWLIITEIITESSKDVSHTKQWRPFGTTSQIAIHLNH
jgi:hypothetical protein